MKLPPRYKQVAESAMVKLWHLLWQDGQNRIALVYEYDQFCIQWEVANDVVRRIPAPVADVDRAIAGGDGNHFKLNADAAAELARCWADILYRCTGYRLQDSISVSVSGTSD